MRTAALHAATAACSRAAPGQSDGILVDIRKASDVESKGAPALPKGQGAKLVRVEFDTIAGARTQALPRMLHAGHACR